MDNFNYKVDQLHVEDVAVSDIASSVGTPFYVYSQSSIEENYKDFENAMSGTKHLICYAMKANSNQAVLKILGNLGAGMDVVSGGNICGLKLLVFQVTVLCFLVLVKHVMK